MTFDNGKYHANVSCMMHEAFVEGNVSEYSIVKTRRYTNLVHQKSKQLSTIRAWNV